MRKIYELDKQVIVPTYMEVLAWQKMPERSASPRVKQLMDDTIGLFGELVAPRGLVDDFETGEFPRLYEGMGLNAPDGPVPLIAARANATALMAVTMGDALAVKSNDLFLHGKVSLGYMLNVVSSAGAERLGRRMCRLFLERLRLESSEAPEIKNLKVQYYCPGHCGWHISGQEKLLVALHADEIGISLNKHYVMHPFKSASGIMIAAHLEVHRFRQGFSFCAECREHKCVERFKLLESEN